MQREPESLAASDAQRALATRAVTLYIQNKPGPHDWTILKEFRDIGVQECIEGKRGASNWMIIAIRKGGDCLAMHSSDVNELSVMLVPSGKKFMQLEELPDEPELRPSKLLGPRIINHIASKIVFVLAGVVFTASGMLPNTASTSSGTSAGGSGTVKTGQFAMPPKKWRGGRG